MDPSATSNTTSASLIRAATVGRVWIELANSSVSARLVTLDHVAKLRYMYILLYYLRCYFFSSFFWTRAYFVEGKNKERTCATAASAHVARAYHREHLINGWFNQGHRSSPRLPIRFTGFWWQIWLILIWFPSFLSFFPPPFRIFLRSSSSICAPPVIYAGEFVWTESLRTQSKMHRSRNQYQLRMHSGTWSRPLRRDELGKIYYI